MDKIRIGQIGCGRRSSAWINTLSVIPGIELVALCDKIPDNIPRALDRTTQLSGKQPHIVDFIQSVKDGKVATYTDHRKMLEEAGLDAVAIVTEPEYQAPLSVECMKAGKHVISEVPATYSLEECWDLVLAAERTGRVYYLSEQFRHCATIIRWHDMVRKNKLGKILFVEGHYIHSMSEERFWVDGKTGERITWKQAAQNPNAVKSRLWTLTHPIWYAPHELSPLLKVLDDRVVRVSCFSAGLNSRFDDVPFDGMAEPFTNPDLEVAMMYTAKGAIIRFAASFTTPVSDCHWWHLLGTKGEVETGRGVNEPDKAYFMPGPTINTSDYHFERTDSTWEFEPGEVPEAAAQTGHGGNDYLPVADFASCLLHGTKPDVDVYRAVETAAPAIMAGISVENGGALQQVSDFRPSEKRKKGEAPRGSVQ